MRASIYLGDWRQGVSDGCSDGRFHQHFQALLNKAGGFIIWKTEGVKYYDQS